MIFTQNIGEKGNAKKWNLKKKYENNVLYLAFNEHKNKKRSGGTFLTDVFETSDKTCYDEDKNIS